MSLNFPRVYPIHVSEEGVCMVWILMYDIIILYSRSVLYLRHINRRYGVADTQFVRLYWRSVQQYFFFFCALRLPLLAVYEFIIAYSYTRMQLLKSVWLGKGIELYDVGIYPCVPT